MVQVASQCNISYLLGEIHQVCHKFAIKKDGGQICLFDGEFLLLDGSDDGLGKRLRIFFFYSGLDVGTIGLFGGRIVLFVFVEDDCIRWAI